MKRPSAFRKILSQYLGFFLEIVREFFTSKIFNLDSKYLRRGSLRWGLKLRSQFIRNRNFCYLWVLFWELLLNNQPILVVQNLGGLEFRLEIAVAPLVESQQVYGLAKESVQNLDLFFQLLLTKISLNSNIWSQYGQNSVQTGASGSPLGSDKLEEKNGRPALVRAGKIKPTINLVTSDYLQQNGPGTPLQNLLEVRL